MKFPKNINGWSGLGRTDARRLDDDAGGDWQRKRRGNVEARNKGGYLKVTVEQDTGVSRFLTLGDDPLTEIRGATLYGAQFSARSTVLAGFNTRSLLPAFGGDSYWVGQFNTNVTVADEFGYSQPGLVASVQRTTTGVSADVVASYPLRQTPVDYATTVVYDGYGALPGARYATDVSGFWLWGNEVVAGVHTALCYRVSGTRAAPVVETSAIYSQSKYAPCVKSVQSVAPDKLLACCGMFVPKWQAPDFSDWANYLPFFMLSSDDAGTTWQRILVNALIQPELDSLAPILASPSVNYVSKLSLLPQLFMFCAVPLSGTLSMVSAMVPYNMGTIPGLGPNEIGARVKTAVYDNTSKTFSSVQTVYDSLADSVALVIRATSQAYSIWERGLSPATGGGVLISESAKWPDNYSQPFKVYYSSDGVGKTLLFTSPLASNNMGRWSALSANTLALPRYEGSGVYALWTTRNLGENWLRRGTITATGTPPAGTAAFLQPSAMTQFSLVTAAAASGVAVNPTPTIPWASDIRITAP